MRLLARRLDTLDTWAGQSRGRFIAAMAGACLVGAGISICVPGFVDGAVQPGAAAEWNCDPGADASPLRVIEGYLTCPPAEAAAKLGALARESFDRVPAVCALEARLLPGS